MRQLGHIVVGVAFWTLLIVLWVLLVVERKAGAARSPTRSSTSRRSAARCSR
jgi:hypothetical protein